MQPCDFFPNIKAEKANAIARYNLFKNINKAVQLMEAFVAVVLISWSSTRLPSVFRLSAEYLLALTSYLMNQHVVFLVGNVIVFVCYLLSRYSDIGHDSGVSGNDETAPDPDSPNPKLVPLQVTEQPLKESGNLIIPYEKVIRETPSEPELRAATAIKQAAKQIERFRRTQSDLKSKISVKRQLPELRRSVTEMRRSGVPVKSIPAVDDLSNEEFRIAVEAFIIKQQRLLKQQSMVKDGS